MSAVNSLVYTFSKEAIYEDFLFLVKPFIFFAISFLTYEVVFCPSVCYLIDLQDYF